MLLTAEAAGFRHTGSLLIRSSWSAWAILVTTTFISSIKHTSSPFQRRQRRADSDGDVIHDRYSKCAGWPRKRRSG